MMDLKNNKHPFVKIFYLKNQPEKLNKNDKILKPTISYLSSLIQKNSLNSDVKEQKRASKRRQLNQKISNINLNLQNQDNKNQTIQNYYQKQQLEPIQNNRSQENQELKRNARRKTFQNKDRRAQTSEQKYIDKIKQINSGRYFIKNQSLREKYQDNSQHQLEDQRKKFLSNVVGNWRNYQNKKMINGVTEQVTKKKYSIQQKSQLQKNKHLMKEDFQIFLGNYTQKLKDKCKKPIQFNLQEYLKEEEFTSNADTENKAEMLFVKSNMFKRLSNYEEKKRKVSKNYQKKQIKIHPSVIGQKQNLIQNFEWSSLAQKEFNIKTHSKNSTLHKKRHSII